MMREENNSSSEWLVPEVGEQPKKKSNKVPYFMQISSAYAMVQDAQRPNKRWKPEK